MLEGRAFATLSARSAAAFRLIAVAGPPGAFGDEGRAVLVPVLGGEFTGEEGRGADCGGWLAWLRGFWWCAGEGVVLALGWSCIWCVRCLDSPLWTELRVVYAGVLLCVASRFV